VTRVGILRDPASAVGIGQWDAIQAAAQSFGIEASPIDLGDPLDIERAIVAFGHSANGGLIITSGAPSVRHRDLIIRTAAEHKLPAVYYAKAFATRGGLISYGVQRIDQFRRAANYVDRILRGAKPADLPVQTPTEYELVINLGTARELGLTVPPSLLIRADEVIE
jgi:putative ABC transport system substrate-binding protein